MAIIKHRRASAAQWTTDNPILREGELGFETDTFKFKIGNGALAWNALPYFLNEDTIGDQITMTDNGDGGFSLNAYKLAGFTWVNNTFAKIANAVQLATEAALAPGIATAGTGIKAARVDHRHPFQSVAPSFLRPSGLWVTDVVKDDGATMDLANGQLAIRPMFLVTPDHQPITIDGLGINVSTAGSGGSTARFGLWSPNADGTINWSDIKTQATTSTDTAGAKKITVSQVTLSEGLYWQGVVMQGGTHGQIRGAHPNSFRVRLHHTDPNASNPFDQIMCFMCTGVTGALPTTSQDLQAVNNAFAGNIWMRVV